MICTSCGLHIAESAPVFKCRQCVSHFVCLPCTTKEHNRSSASPHRLEQLNRTVNSTEATAVRVPAEARSNPQVRSTSIFTSKEYLTMLLGYCDHCLKVMVPSKDVFFQCDQCPMEFDVCAQCITLMPREHPSMHTFTKHASQSEFSRIAHGLFHLGIVCDRCKAASFNGVRHHCEQCEDSYDLCEDCIGKTHRHHTFKIFPNPLLRAMNNASLARRTLAIIATNKNAQYANWCDPLTGWTKSDAEHMVKQAEKEADGYQMQIKRIEDAELADAKARLEQAQESARLQDKIKRDLMALSIAGTGGHVTYLHQI